MYNTLFSPQSWRAQVKPHQTLTLKNRFRFCKANIIGSGSFGDCYLADDLETGKQCVLKVSQVGDSVDNLMHEARQLEACNHPCIARGMDHFVHDGEFYIVMDYYSNGDLQHYLSSHNASPELIRRWLTQITSAVNYLHAQKILHRDLKLQNVFLSESMDAYLGDFGTVKELVSTRHARTFVGTPQGMSPELINECPYGMPADIYALGAALFEMCEGRPPFRANNFMALMRQITEGVHEPFTDRTPEDLRGLIDNMLEKDPTQRITSYELCCILRPGLDALGLPEPFCIDTELTLVGDQWMTAEQRPEATIAARLTSIVDLQDTSPKTPSEAIKQRLFRRIYAAVQNEDRVYKLIVACTLLIQGQEPQQVADFLQVIPWAQRDGKYKREHFLQYLLDQMGVTGDTKEAAHLVDRLSVIMYASDTV